MKRKSLSNIEHLPRQHQAQMAIQNPVGITRELNNRSFYHFLKYFWPDISTQQYEDNWHIPLLCDELQAIGTRVGKRLPKENDLIINIPPGMTKTIICSIAFPAWCWTKWHWMRFITVSYSGALSLESAEYCRDLIRSQRFREVYPEIEIKEDKDTKSNFKIVKRLPKGRGMSQLLIGGNRFSTSVGGTLTGFHADIIIWDDPLNPQEAASDKELESTNRWLDQTLPTRKTDKRISATIGIMQRLHQNDPTGHILAKKKKNIRHICLPGEIETYEYKLNPPELKQYYKDKLLDANRLNWDVLEELEADLGQTGYSGQIGQDPTPPGGALFKVDHFVTVRSIPTSNEVMRRVRYWDKAATEGKSCYTVGVLMTQLVNGRWLIEHVKRGQWATEEREKIIRSVAEADGKAVTIYLEQEPGSGGKESVEASIRNLAGFTVYADRPTGDKATRADPYSVQVNNGNVLIFEADWNHEYIEEHRFYPYSKYKDQVDAASGAFNHLTSKKIARRLT